MHHYVSVTFRNQSTQRVDLAGLPPMERDTARQWLDAQFVALECEALRATGKLLMTDRVVVVAQAAGPERFADAVWAQTFAQATSTALGKPVVNIDADSLSITY